MRDIFPHTFVSLDLIEKITTIRELHRDPSPYFTLPRLVECDDVVMDANMFVEGHLHLELAGTDAAMPGCVFLVDKFHSEDWSIFLWWTGFLDTADEGLSEILAAGMENQDGENGV